MSELYATAEPKRLAWRSFVRVLSADGSVDEAICAARTTWSDFYPRWVTRDAMEAAIEYVARQKVQK